MQRVGAGAGGGEAERGVSEASFSQRRGSESGAPELGLWRCGSGHGALKVEL